MARRLNAMGLLTELDGSAFAVYCQSYGRWIEAERKLAEFGLVIKSPNGTPVQNPYLSIANRAMDQMKTYLIEFGMTPSSRSRLAPWPHQEEDDEVEEFLYGKSG